MGSPKQQQAAGAAGGGAAAAGGAVGAAGMKGNTAMMEAVRKLIAMNPEYLTSGIPNDVFQLFMQSTAQRAQTPAPMPSMQMPMQVNLGNVTASAAAAAAAAAAAHASAVAYGQQEEDEVDYEEMGVAETYADYWPAKCELFPCTFYGI